MALAHTSSANPSASGALALLRALLLAGLCVAACCAIAILNGLPLILSDTSTYLASASNLAVPWDRPIFYGLFMRPFLFAHLWPVIVAQSAITVYVLWVAARISCPGMSALRFAAVTIALCLVSTLPWVAGQLMPDIFAPLAVLGIYVLFFGGHELERSERVTIGALTAFAISTHLSHIPLAVAMIIVCAFVRWSLCGGQGTLRRVGIAAAALAVAVGAVSVSNAIQSGKPMLSRGGGLFALAKLLESGAAQSYLAKVCPEAGFALCAVANDLPSDVNGLLWADASTVRQVARPVAVMDEAGTIAFETLATFPVAVIKHSAASAVQQFFSYSVASGPDAGAVSALLENADLGEEFREAALSSRQARGVLSFELADSLMLVGLVIALASTIWALRADAGARLAALLATILAGVVMNAIVCGALSIVDGRYQARVVWLLPFFGLLVLSESWRGSRLPQREMSPAVKWPPST